ncbi:thiamine ABC transporter substrate binding subunit [Gallibacterium anatis]|uniref:thiamine ABC transporter substrate binding subunit n=1 Tax=Gallibacterium anatis TaxID=750 RepID=UPI001B3249D7|nr:thiamine ABC transporter substrate binding subunit [Gallibacterium anatis]MBP4133374.1 thiamine ABC transporter substrate binding subunit [Gallibacterium anatis]
MLKKTLFLSVLTVSTISFANAETLTVYTYDSFASDWGPAPKLEAIFEKQCGCDLKFVPFEDSVTMFNRVRLEGKKSKADVVLGLDQSLIEAADQSQLFTKTDIKLDNLHLPLNWQNQTYIPYDFGSFAFVYDTTKLSNPPKSLKELIERQDLRVIYQDPRTSSVGRGLLLWVNQVYPQDQVAQAWQQLAKHTVTVGKGWTETYGAFLKGESDLVLSYRSSPLYHQLNEQKQNYAATAFSEGNILQIEIAAKLKASKQTKLADQFLQFLLSSEAQNIISQSNVMFAVTDAPIEPHYDQLRHQVLTEKTIDTSNISHQQTKQWLAVWQNALAK